MAEVSTLTICPSILLKRLKFRLVCYKWSTNTLRLKLSGGASGEVVIDYGWRQSKFADVPLDAELDWRAGQTCWTEWLSSNDLRHTLVWFGSASSVNVVLPMFRLQVTTDQMIDWQLSPGRWEPQDSLVSVAGSYNNPRQCFLCRPARGNCISYTPFKQHLPTSASVVFESSLARQAF